VVVPLLLPLRGLLHGRLYTHRWVPYLALAYVGHALVELTANPAERPYAALELLFSLSLFMGALLYARHAGREQ